MDVKIEAAISNIEDFLVPVLVNYNMVKSPSWLVDIISDYLKRIDRLKLDIRKAYDDYLACHSSFDSLSNFFQLL